MHDGTETGTQAQLAGGWAVEPGRGVDGERSMTTMTGRGKRARVHGRMHA